MGAVSHKTKERKAGDRPAQSQRTQRVAAQAPVHQRQTKESAVVVGGCGVEGEGASL